MSKRTVVCMILIVLWLATSAVADEQGAVELSAPPSYVAPADAQPVDLVICLDASGSMKQLLDAVRARLWDVVNELAEMTPAPDLRVGFLTFGTRETTDREGWIAVQTDLTRDLDLVFDRLMQLQTSGDEEYVGRAIHAALEQMSWSEEWGALRIIFVAGNESADQGVEAFDFRDQAAEARDREIFVNTLYAGNLNNAVEHHWDKLAALGGGNFATVGRKPDALQIAAPQDPVLRELNAQLNGTYVPLGQGGQDGLARVAATDASASKLGQQSLSSRIVAKSSGLYNQAAWDLVDAMDQPGFDWAGLRPEDLPEGLRGLSEEDLRAAVEEKRAEREEIRRRIRELDLERRRYLQAVLAEKYPGRVGVGDAMRQAIRSQAASRGFSRDE